MKSFANLSQLVFFLFFFLLSGKYLIESSYSYWGGFFYIFCASIFLSVFIYFLGKGLKSKYNYFFPAFVLPFLLFNVVWLFVSVTELAVGLLLLFVAILIVVFAFIFFIDLIKAFFWGW